MLVAGLEPGEKHDKNVINTVFFIFHDKFYDKFKIKITPLQ